MSPGGAQDPVAAERRRRARRLARDLHPDRGGDPDLYLRAMAALDRTEDRPDGRPDSESGGDLFPTTVQRRWWVRASGGTRSRLRAWRRQRRRRPGSGWTQI